MVFNPVYDKISALSAKKGETVQSVVEGSFKLLGLKEVLNVVCRCRVLKADCADGFAKAEGVLECKILYLGEENAIKSETFTCELVAKSKHELKGGKVRAECTVVDSGVSALSGEEVKISSVVETCFIITECEEISSLSVASTGFYLKDASERYVACKCSDRAKTEYSLSDKTVMDEVVFTRGTCIINKRNCGVDSISVEGEVILETVGMKNGEICSQTIAMPYSETFECNGTGYGDTAVASVKVTFSDAVIIDVEDGKKLDGVVKCTFDIATYSDSEFSVVSDVLGIKKQLLPTVKSYNVCEKISNFTILERVDGNIKLGDNMPACDVILTSSAFDCVINSIKCEDGSVNVEGVVSGRVVYSCSSPEKTVSAFVVAPFAFSALVPLTERDEVVANACVTAVTCRVRRGNEIDVKADVAVEILSLRSKEIAVISELTEGEDIVVPTSAFSVYISEGGEDLWSVASALGVTPDTVTEQNNLTFPLTKGDKVTVYRALDSKKI